MLHLSQASWLLERERAQKVADGLVVTFAVVLPWSTSASAIVMVLWIAAGLATLTRQSLLRTVASPAGGLPIVLCLLALVGTAWAFGVSATERWEGLDSYFKLAAISLMMAQFMRSERGSAVMTGYLISCGVLLALSWALVLIPSLYGIWPRTTTRGVPVHDYIAQSEEFAICMFLLAAVAMMQWRKRCHWQAGLLWLAAALFLLNILFVSTSRTVLVVLPLLLVAFAFIWLSGRATIAFLAGVVVAGALTWNLAPLVRGNITGLIGEVQAFTPNTARGRAGQRVEYWRNGIDFVADAPVAGRGTGAIRKLYRDAEAAGRTGVFADNPHNQIFAVALQLGGIGTAVLFAMWLAHLMLFRGPGLLPWAGFVIVAQNIVGSLFNSHLFDFVQGWGYVIGFGVAAGMVLRQKQREALAQPAPSP